MKKMPAFFICQCFFWLLIVLLPNAGQAQKRTAIKTRIDSLVATQQYNFQADFIQPMSGTPVLLTDEYYSVSITRDSITAFLPYIGIAYVAPLNPQEGGIKFTSRNFSYDRRQRRNGIWEITIKPRDVQDVQRLDIFISPNGQTQLQVVRVTAQPVSFMGELAH